MEFQGTPPLGMVRVLVVDKDDSRELLADVLRDEGARVETANDAASALSVLDRWLPDVLVANVGMPVLEGCALLTQVRARAADRGGAVPAVAVSGYFTVERRRACAVAGFGAYLQKPLNLDAIQFVILRLIGSQGHRQRGCEKLR